LLNILAILLPFGTKSTMTAMVGKYIGAADIKKAYVYYKHLLVFMAFVIILQYSLLYLNRDSAALIFTQDQNVK